MENYKNQNEDSEVDDFFEMLRTITNNGKMLDFDSMFDSIVNPREVQKVMYVYKLLRDTTGGENVTVNLELHEPFRSCGGVSVEGDSIVIYNTPAFMTALMLSDNFEVIPKLHGKTEMVFGFNDLAEYIWEEQL